MTIVDLDALYLALMTDLPPVIRANLAMEATSAAIKAKTDLLDTSAVTVVAVVNGSTITIQRGDTLSAAIINLGSLAGYVSIDFTVKRNTEDSDDDAAIRIRKNFSETDDGLVRLNGAAHTTGSDGSITLTDEIAGDINIMLKAAIASVLELGQYVYDVQVIKSDSVSTKTAGKLIVSADVTRLVA